MTLETRVAARLDALTSRPATRFFENSFQNFSKKFLPDEKLVLAVSGGGDSIALMHIAARWAQARPLVVVTVDHGLRPESSDEAAFVAGAAKALGLPHHTLRWDGWDGRGNLQDAARLTRRALIEEFARAQGISAVLTGHTSDDQAETVLMRLARGSGVDGLAGMAAMQMHGALWLRPLLDVSRQELRDYLGDRAVGWIDDPSNDDARFDRVKARQMLSNLSELGLNAVRLTDTARHMAAARLVLDAAMGTLAEQAVRQEHGDLLIDRALFDAAAAETRTRLLARALSFVSGNPYRPRYAALSALVRTGAGTLHGCQITQVQGHLRVLREYQAVCDMSCDTNELWDGRWHMQGPHDAGLRLAPLGREGAKLCKDKAAAGLPHVSAIASPAVWRGGDLVAAPLAGLANGWRAKLAQPRADFIQSLLLH